MLIPALRGCLFFFPHASHVFDGAATALFAMNPTVVLTGGIACGKSLFASFLARAGCEILDADDVARGLQAPGGAALAAIREIFGGAVFDADGALSRATLASVVFADPAARRALEGIVHPLVAEAFSTWRSRPSTVLRVAVIPLLFETGGERDWPHVTCVASTPELQLARLMQRGHSERDARARVRAQLPLSQKINRSRLTVWNNGTPWELRGQALDWMRKTMRDDKGEFLP